MGIDAKAVRKRLESRREELTKLDAMSEDSRQAVTLDQQSVGRLSRMDAMQQQAMAQATARQRTTELNRIDAALTRIADGDYGECLECGEAIAPKRLEADPTATHCVGCASLQER